jgi:exonuclease SbcD
MKVLHTSNLHIGRALYGRKRYEEFEAFLNWLAVILPIRRRIDYTERDSNL